MVELGTVQDARNAAFARAAAAGAGMQLSSSGGTNRRALQEGATGSVLLFERRQQAADHVMATAAPGDVVLYENDLPDHYP